VSILLAVLAELFMICGIVTLYLTPYPVTLTAWHLVAVFGSWNVAWLGSAWLLRGRLADFDSLILLLAALLTGWGLIMQTRLAPAMIYRQVLWLLIGCCVMCAIALPPGLTRRLRRYRYTLLTSGILLLGATLIFGVNPSGQGQELWLGAFGFYMQPSEPLKLLVVIYLAAYLAEKRDLPAMRAAGPGCCAALLLYICHDDQPGLGQVAIQPVECRPLHPRGDSRLCSLRESRAAGEHLARSLGPGTG
jgi:hypothetical protein